MDRSVTNEKWDEYVARAQKYFDTGLLDSEENDYKIKLGHEIAVARQAVIDGEPEWASLLKKGLPSGNPITWRTKADFSDWLSESPDSALGCTAVDMGRRYFVHYCENPRLYEPVSSVSYKGEGRNPC